MSPIWTAIVGPLPGFSLLSRSFISFIPLSFRNYRKGLPLFYCILQFLKYNFYVKPLKIQYKLKEYCLIGFRLGVEAGSGCVCFGALFSASQNFIEFLSVFFYMLLQFLQ